MTLVGDADRERALAVLRRHYAEGRLDPDELSSRVHVAAVARSTADVRTALRGLPNGLLEAVLAPRVLALGSTPAFRTARRIALAVFVSAVWLFATMVLLVAYAVSLVVSGPSTLGAGIFAAGWLLVTWLSWHAWRRGSHRG